MLFDPDIELTFDETVTRVWNRLQPNQQAPFLREAEERSCPLELIIAEAITEFVRLLQDPKERRAYEDKLDRREAPYGIDPHRK